MEKTVVSINGALHHGNYIWAGAMNLAWDELVHVVIKQPLSLKSENAKVIAMCHNFNKTPFTKQSVTADSYYVKCGYGPATLVAINKESKQKFPNKSFPDLEYNLHESDIISYAYLFKQVSYEVPFTREKVHFNGKTYKGFKAHDAKQRKNLGVGQYIDDDNFTVKLNLQQPNEELFVIKGHEKSAAHQVIEHVKNLKEFTPIGAKQNFTMPIVDLSVERTYDELTGIPLKNNAFTQYKIEVMLERIKFRIDEVGAKVENEAVIIMTRMMVMVKRSFHVDKPFWIVMKQKGKFPYFVAQFNNGKFMNEQ